MERRLDVTLVRLGYALNLEHARTLIKEGSISVDDRIIKQADYLLSAASTVKAGYSTLPFVLLYREHLKHYPHT
jgi:ribosomal protein S4